MVYSGVLPLPQSSMRSYRTVDSAGAIVSPRAGVHHVVRHLVAATVVDDSMVAQRKRTVYLHTAVA